jgi:hypothetical protein
MGQENHMAMLVDVKPLPAYPTNALGVKQSVPEGGTQKESGGYGVVVKWPALVVVELPPIKTV